MAEKKRGRALGLNFAGETGPLNAITDVPGLAVGETTILRTGETGQGVHTGVTAILPYGHDSQPQIAHAGLYALNGNGEMTGTHWIRDAGSFLGPICLTNTHSVGIAHHATVRWMIRHYGPAFTQNHLWAMPVIAETYDGVLNDINGQHVTEADVIHALDTAHSGPVREGNSGGGTGMICYEYKGGTGSASRRVTVGGEAFTFGVLVQANHGRRDWLTVLGEPVGRLMRDHLLLDKENGSIIVIIATDAPLRPDQLERLARRGAIGIGRSGTIGGNNSGDIFLALSTGNARPLPQLDTEIQTMRHLNDEHLDPVYDAVVGAVDEAIINAMLAAQDMTTLKPAGLLCKAIDPVQLCDLLRPSGKCR